MRPSLQIRNAAAAAALLTLPLIGCDGGSGPSEADLATAPRDLAVAVTDAGGGDASSSADTWTSFAKQFMEDYCVSCHSAGGSGYRGGALDFRRYDKIVVASATIRCGTASTRPAGCGSRPIPEQFPIGNGPKPTTDERARLVAWIEAGMPL